MSFKWRLYRGNPMSHTAVEPEQLPLPDITPAPAGATLDRDEDPTPPVLQGYYDPQTRLFETD